MSNVKFFAKTIFNLHRPIIKNTVLFRSFYGQYNDSPKYISEELHRRAPDVNIIWTIRDGKQTDFPSYVKLVKLDSPEYIKYIARAEVVVDNYTGCRSSISTSKNLVRRIVFRLASKKRKGQYNLSTWHGTPLKHIALDEPQYKNASYVKPYFATDIILSDSKLTTSAFKSAFNWGDKPLLECGMPRNDIFFEQQSGELKEKLGLPKDKKVILFAPTFRDSVEMSGLKQVKELNIKGLLESLSNKFGGEWCFAFRCHGNVMASVLKDSALDSQLIINGNAHPDMAEYLACVDVLLTDYSSCMFDYMYSKKPCFLYVPDLESYKNSERGFYFDIEETPFDICKDEASLIDAIKSYDEKEYLAKREEFIAKLGKFENGTASKVAVDLILQKLTVKGVK